MYWHWGKDYDNLCNELAFFSDCDSAANVITTNAHSTATNAHSKTNTYTNPKTNAYACSYTATNVDTDTASRPANKYCAAHCYGNGGCYAC
jgi:hypothetical protein